MPKSDQIEIRQDLIDFLHKELVGPRDARVEVVKGQLPHKRYIAGVLFPRQTAMESDSVEEDADQEPKATQESPREREDLDPPKTESGLVPQRPDAVEARDSLEDLDEGISLANAYFPSAISLTLAVHPEVSSLRILPQASSYHPIDASEISSGDELRQWRRRPEELDSLVVPVSDKKASDTAVIRYLIPDRLTLRATARPVSSGCKLVTISLCNECARTCSWPRAEECYFQVGLVVQPNEDEAPFVEMPRGNRRLDEEEKSLDLLYRNRKVFGRGHGCAAEWTVDEDSQRVLQISTSTLPATKVPPVEPLSRISDALSMERLSGFGLEDPRREVLDLLSWIPDAYEEWIGEQRGAVSSLELHHRSTGERHIENCQQALTRIRRGIDTLEKSPEAMRAFMLANRAMLMQQVHSRRPRRLPTDPLTPLPKGYRSFEDEETGQVTGYWRVFQLAFILMTLGAFVGDHQEEERDLVDLIWFPTGGGKTEAYLGLAAFVIFLRRLRWSADAGCTVLMRYTLRLLTAQQFQRASALLCACELIRREEVETFGPEPIRIGLWAGSKVSPNGRDDAKTKANRLIDGSLADNPFPVRECAWCGTALDQDQHWGYRIREGSVRLICPESSCPFAEDPGLPILMIDEDIYQTPPELILGTVDKFALLAWTKDAGRIFGHNDPTSPHRSPPQLIIQDELHLISGPLGSMVGHYEAAIDFLCRKGNESPKIVASTATIRRAMRQCRDLYAREAFQFPPPGLDASDSFFAKEDAEAPGRIYLGVFPSAASSPVVAQGKTVAALLQGAASAGEPGITADEDRDPYWTLVQYFSSLRELGRAFSMMEDEVPEYLRELSRARGLSSEEKRRIRRFEGMTSRRPASEIPEILKGLERKYSTSKEKNSALDSLLATNMISVGMDVTRLGLMLVAGQPKTTSEYIQASSRVGRGNPGLVVTLYNTNRPRDRSHYEHHKGFHQSFYKYVEPTSSTPFSIPVQERALAALLIIAARQRAGVTTPQDFGESKHQERVEEFLSFLIARAEKVSPHQAGALEKRFRGLMEQWESGEHKEWGTHYPKPEMELPLFYNAGKNPDPDWGEEAWPIPSSMRSVDGECHGKIVIRYAEEEER